MDWRDLPFDAAPRGSEAELLQFALDRARRQFAWKTGGLDAEQPLAAPSDGRSWVENDRWGWDSAVTDEPEELYALLYGAAARSRAAWQQLSADGGLDVVVPDPDPAWSPKRRMIALDLLEEYLKHTGHADVLREAVDGVTGNDPD